MPYKEKYNYNEIIILKEVCELSLAKIIAL